MSHGWKRGFNARQNHRSIYPSNFNRLRAIARYWSEIATFSYPLYLTPPVGGDPLGRSLLFLVGELPDGEATIWYKNISEKLNPARHRRQTDRRQTDLPCHAISQTQRGHVWLKTQMHRRYSGYNQMTCVLSAISSASFFILFLLLCYTSFLQNANFRLLK